MDVRRPRHRARAAHERPRGARTRGCGTARGRRDAAPRRHLCGAQTVRHHTHRRSAAARAHHPLRRRGQCQPRVVRLAAPARAAGRSGHLHRHRAVEFASHVGRRVRCRQLRNENAVSRNRCGAFFLRPTDNLDAVYGSIARATWRVSTSSASHPGTRQSVSTSVCRSTSTCRTRGSGRAPGTSTSSNLGPNHACAMRVADAKSRRSSSAVRRGP